ncbi:hypothetical protein H632_c4482p0, partial [Helicosporidium sp. ATCC 50920]
GWPGDCARLSGPRAHVPAGHGGGALPARRRLSLRQGGGDSPRRRRPRGAQVPRLVLRGGAQLAALRLLRAARAGVESRDRGRGKGGPRGGRQRLLSTPFSRASAAAARGDGGPQARGARAGGRARAVQLRAQARVAQLRLRGRARAHGPAVGAQAPVLGSSAQPDSRRGSSPGRDLERVPGRAPVPAGAPSAQAPRGRAGLAGAGQGRARDRLGAAVL